MNRYTVDPAAPEGTGGGSGDYRYGEPFPEGRQKVYVVWVEEYQKDDREMISVTFGVPPVAGNATGAKCDYRCAAGYGPRWAGLVKALYAPEMAAGETFEVDPMQMKGRTAVATLGKRLYEGTWYPEITALEPPVPAGSQPDPPREEQPGMAPAEAFDVNEADIPF